MKPYDATVVIATKNRRDDLRRALESCMRQTVRLQVVVCDDGSTDGSDRMVRDEFPKAELHRVERSVGYVVQRNKGARLAKSRYIFSIDDDAEFSSPHTVEQTLAEFDHPRIGVVAVPFINVKQPGDEEQRPPDEDRWALYYFIGTAHAIRRDVFLKLGGYREVLFHFGEERDLSARLLQAGYVVRVGSADPIVHYESPRRDYSRISHYMRRNDMLFAWHNVPWPYMPIHMIGSAISGIRIAAQRSAIVPSLHGLADGLRTIRAERDGRRPLSPRVYRLHRRLLRRGPHRLRDIEPLLPPLTTPSGSETE